MSKSIVVSEQELKEVKYHDLLAKFTELGIPQVWKAGKKKATMIEKAIEELKIKKSLEAKGLSEKEVEVELEAIKEKKVELQQAEKLEVAIQAELEEKKEVKKVVDADLSREVIEANLVNIKKQMIQCVPAHRMILIKKRDLLLDLLSKI
jgi:hypothetical protein